MGSGREFRDRDHRDLLGRGDVGKALSGGQSGRGSRLELFTRLAGRRTGAIGLVVLKHALTDRLKGGDFWGKLGLQHRNHRETVAIQGLGVGRLRIQGRHALRQALHRLQAHDALAGAERSGAAQRDLQFRGRHRKGRCGDIGQGTQFVVETIGGLTGQTQGTLRQRLVTDLAKGGFLAEHLVVLIAESVGAALLVELLQPIGEASLIGDHRFSLGDVVGRIKAHIHQDRALRDAVIGDAVAVELGQLFRLGRDARQAIGDTEQSSLGHPALIVAAIVGLHFARRHQTGSGPDRLDQVLNANLLADILQERGLVDAGTLTEILDERVVVETSRVGVLEVLP